MREIEVFYHLFVPPDARHSMWTWWVDEQLGLLKTSKLADVAKINMAMTIPMYFMPGKNYPGNFASMVVEYIESQYPFVNILDIRDTAEQNIFEGQTLRFLYDRCQQSDIDVLYFHNKGITSQTTFVSEWRKILNYYCVEQWPSCVKQLRSADAVGVRDRQCADHMMSGNFWWSKSEYIRTLPEPIDSTQYQNRPDFYPGGVDYRYSFEDWLWSNTPRVHHVVDTQTDHFSEFSSLELLKNK